MTFFDSIFIYEKPDFVDITDDAKDTGTLNISLSTSSAKADKTNHSLYSYQGLNNTGKQQYYILSGPTSLLCSFK